MMWGAGLEQYKSTFCFSHVQLHDDVAADARPLQISHQAGRMELLAG